MITFGAIARGGAVLAVAGLAVGMAAGPAGSQVVPDRPLLVTGSVECQTVSDGPDGRVWVITYTARNLVDPQSVPESVAPAAATPSAFGDIEITTTAVALDAQLIGTVDFEPNPLPAGATATDGGPISGALTGRLVMAVTWTAPTLETSGSETVELLLDDSCRVPVTTTGAPQVQAIEVSPAFTG